MKILLVFPRFLPYSSPSLGVAYLASYLRSFNFDVSVLDCTFESKESAKKKLLSKDYDVIGFSAKTSDMADAIELVNTLKRAGKKSFIAFGGAHATALPKDTLKHCDVVCVGEAEETFYEVCVALKNKKSFKDIKGICYRDKKGKIISTGRRPFIEDLDKIPHPARDLLPMDLYAKNKSGRLRWCLPQPSISIITTRGCPANCTYCATKQIHGRKIRYRSVANVIDEIKMLQKEYGIRSFHFYDDTPTASLEWLTELCNELKKLNIKWSINTRVDVVDEHKLKMMKDAGCSFISFGIESGSQRILDDILKKGISLKKVKEVFDLTHKLGIMNHGSCMVGIPGETKKDIEKTINFVKEIKADFIQFAMLVPLPGTEIYDYIEEHGGRFLYNSWKDFTYYDKPVFEMPGLSRKEVKKMMVRGYLGFYLRPSYFFGQFYKMIKNYEYFIQIKNGFTYFVTKLVLRK